MSCGSARWLTSAPSKACDGRLRSTVQNRSFDVTSPAAALFRLPDGGKARHRAVCRGCSVGLDQYHSLRLHHPRFRLAENAGCQAPQVGRGAGAGREMTFGLKGRTSND